VDSGSPDVPGTGGMIVDSGNDRVTPGTGGSGTGGAPATDRCPAARWTLAVNNLCDTALCTDIPANKKVPAGAIDGDPATRYTTGRFQGSNGPETVTITFPGNVTISGFHLLNTSPGDAPAQYKAEFAVGAGTVFSAFQAPVAGAGSDDLMVTFPQPTTLRALRVTQTGTKSANWWSIHEFTVQDCVNAN
jgi:hypothetical protein